MSHRSRLALGLAGGYLLGRYRKTRWLLAVAALVASKRLGEAALQRGEGEGGSSQELKKLTEQGRETAAALLANQIRGLSSRLHQTTESLQPSSSDSEPPEAADEATEGANGGQPTGESDDAGAPEEPGESNEPSDSEGTGESEDTGKPSDKSGSPKRRSTGSRSGASSGQRAQVSGRPDGLGAARRRR